MNIDKKGLDAENISLARRNAPKRVFYFVALLSCLMMLIPAGIGLHAAFSAPPRHNAIYIENQKPGSTKWETPQLLSSIRKSRLSPPKNDDAPSDNGSLRTADDTWVDTSISWIC